MMIASEYYGLLRQNVSKINPTPDTFAILEQLIISINVIETENITSSIQVITDPIYKTLALESLLATKKFISDIVIGANFLRYNTIPISKVRRINVEVIPPTKNENNQYLPYSFKLQILYGQDNQIFHYNAISDYVKIMELKKELDKLICG